MRVWERARLIEDCGGCGQSQAMGTPIQVISVTNLRRRIRCVLCADGPLDADQIVAFDAAEAARADVKPWTPVDAPAFTGHTRPLFDPKRAAAGDRDE
jgi:hypothetical protein